MSDAPKRASAKKGSSQPRGQQASPWPKRFLIAGGIGVVLLLVGAVLFSPTPLRGVPEETESVAVGAPEHIEGDIYAEDEVPAGGAHAAAWLNCGFYDTPVPAENAVHSLEHGAVWITHRPDLAPEQVDRLSRFAGGVDKVIVSPVAGQSSPILVTAWANQLELSDADDSRLEQFVNEFERSLDAPEPGGACSGGVGRPVG